MVNIDKNEVSNIRPPKPLVISHDSDMTTTWKLWSQQFNWYSIATQVSKKSTEVQAAIFMTTIGAEAAAIFNSFNLTNEEQINIETIKSKFEEYFIPKTNITFERYIFNKVEQEESESFEEYLTRLKLLSKKCDFGTLHDDLLRDRIVVGIRNEAIQEKLLSQDDLKLDKTIQICKASEQTKKQLKDMQNKGDLKSVELIRKKYLETDKTKTEGNKKLFKNCSRCGRDHVKEKCPAYKLPCNKCRKLGHFGNMCFTKDTKKVKAINQKIEESDEEFFVETVNYKSRKNGDWTETIEIKNGKIIAKLDTGAQCNVLPVKIIYHNNLKIKPTHVKKILSYCHNNIEVIGEINLKCRIKNQTRYIVFLVVKEDVTPVLGKDTCVEIGLIKRVAELQETIKEDIYKGLGCLKDFEYDIDLKDDPKFEIKPPRRIPHAIRNLVKEELDKMVEMQVIKPINEPTPVVSPMVIVKQKGRLRICIDPTDVNRNLLRRHHPLKTIEEIAAGVRNSKLFTKLDCKKGFWQIKLSERTQKYLTFATPWGRYSCTRLPFGIASAPEVFQKIISKLLEGIDGVENSMDDIIIHASMEEELERRTQEVIKVLRTNGLKLNKEKCEFKKKRITFLGHILTENGLEVDPEKIEAINQLKTPKTVKELQRFLGMITYLGKFIPGMSDITAPLRELTHKNIEWHWTEQHHNAIEKLKEVIKTAPVLKYYDVNSDVKISADASSKAMGAVLMQENRPVAYATKALTTAQQQYPQIEKEALAIKFACKKFHEYIYGKQLTIETDHKPIETISKKSLEMAPPRLQRILLEVKQYNPTIIYKKGTEMYIADTLSRDCQQKMEEIMENELEVQIIVPLSERALGDLRQEIKKDNELNETMVLVQQGWPEINSTDNRYFNHRDELSVYDNILFKNNKIIIPAGMKQKILSSIHKGHMGIQSSIRRARYTVFWIGMDKDIKDTVEKCSICQARQKDPEKEPLILKEIPTRPWEIVASDIFNLKGKDYLLIADSYSGFFDFEPLKCSNTNEVIKLLKKWFATHGIPRRLETDNGPQYGSAEFKKFVTSWNFEHQTSSPHYPRSNGLAERFVQTAKNLLKKCIADNSDIYLALLNFRNTPRTNKMGSPAQRLMGRRTKTLLPTAENKLQPQVQTNVHQKLVNLRNKQKYYADRSTKNAPNVNVGDKVRVRTSHRNWTGGEVIQMTEQPRSVIVKTDNGVYRRNTSFIRPTKATITPTPNIILPDEKPPMNLNNTPKEGHVKRDLDPVESTTMVLRSGRVLTPRLIS